MAPVKRSCSGVSPTASHRSGRLVLGDFVVPENPSDLVTTLDPDYDKRSSIADQLRWLTAAGLQARVAWAHRDLAVLVGHAPTNRDPRRTSANAASRTGPQRSGRLKQRCCGARVARSYSARLQTSATTAGTIAPADEAVLSALARYPPTRFVTETGWRRRRAASARLACRSATDMPLTSTPAHYALSTTRMPAPAATESAAS